jgi:hypothetical protein
MAEIERRRSEGEAKATSKTKRDNCISAIKGRKRKIRDMKTNLLNHLRFIKARENYRWDGADCGKSAADCVIDLEKAANIAADASHKYDSRLPLKVYGYARSTKP